MYGSVSWKPTSTHESYQSVKFHAQLTSLSLPPILPSDTLTFCVPLLQVSTIADWWHSNTTADQLRSQSKCLLMVRFNKLLLHKAQESVASHRPPPAQLPVYVVCMVELSDGVTLLLTWTS
jgi:hypothetical protein